MIYSIPEEEAYAAVEFPFELIGSYVAVQDIPQYDFKLERQVKEETDMFREEENLRILHQKYQRRQTRDNQPDQASAQEQQQHIQLQPVRRATTSMLESMSTVYDNRIDYGPSNSLKLTDSNQSHGSDSGNATPRPRTKRFMSLFKSYKQKVSSK
ncbi:hypothetical protein GGI12_003425 [Dipsacomyces acuminosporus]|nr:hypothetical protein GGI12_003425 [Dipsacomyces acuminosporus]